MSSNDHRPRTIFYFSRVRGIGGTQRQTLELFRRSDPSRFRFVSISNFSGHFEQHVAELGIPSYVIEYCRKRRLSAFGRLIRPGKWRLMESNPEVFPKIQELVERYEPQLVVGNDWDYRILSFMRANYPIPVVCHVRGEPARRFLGTTRDFEKYIAISHRLRERCVSNGFDRSSFVVVNDGIDTTRFAPFHAGMPEDLDPGKEIVRIAFVGRVQAEKRTVEFIRSLKPWRDRDLPVRVYFIGESLAGHEGYAKRCQRAVQSNGLERYVKFVGHYENIVPVLNAVDILVTLSGGSVMLEAMALGKPVVACARPSPPGHSIVKHMLTGLLYDFKDLKGARKGIEMLIEDPELRAQMGWNGREKAAVTFNMDDRVAETGAVYDEVIRSYRSSHGLC